MYHPRHPRNWYDYNAHLSKEAEYMQFYDTSIIPNRSIIKNPSIVPRIPRMPKTFNFPAALRNTTQTQDIPQKPDSTMPKIPDALKLSKGKLTNASDTSIPEDVLMKARFANASKIYYSSGESAAQDYIDSFGYNYTIEHNLSTGIGLVLINNETGETTISYRGTDVNNPADLLTDTLGMFGQETFSPEYGLVKEQLEAVTEMYGAPTELVGFSRGSVLSMNLGNEYGIPTTELNPFISPSLVLTQDSGSKHEIFRTLNDPVSLLAAGTKADSNWNVRSILPIQDTVNPLEEHMLTQLLTNDTPRRTGAAAAEQSALVDALHPTSVAKGLAGGILGYQEASSINKLTGGALGASGTAGLGGAIGATNTSLFSAALAGTSEGLTAAALLPEAVAGASGGLAGYETSVAVAQALKNKGANQDTIQSVSAIAGGGVGGATAAAVGVGASVAAASVTGGEIGTLLAPETAGASIAIGAGVGAAVGAGSYVVGQASEAGSALLSEISSNTIDPYYVMPDYDSNDMNSVMGYMHRQQAAQSLQRQDEAQGITPEQRNTMNKAAATASAP